MSESLISRQWGPKLWFFWGTLVLAVVADQLTKWWVAANLVLYRDEIEVIPGLLSIIHAENKGAAFSALEDFAWRIPLFIAFAVVATVIILDLWRRLHVADRFHAFTMALILAGAWGNAIDRALEGEVTDFVLVYTEHPPVKAWLIEHVGMYQWPAFNVADMALVVGVSLFVLGTLFLSDEPEDDPAEE